MVQKAEKIWFDGKLVPWDEANVHVLTHTLHYGCGVFEGIRAYKLRQGRVLASTGSRSTWTGMFMLGQASCAWKSPTPREADRTNAMRGHPQGQPTWTRATSGPSASSAWGPWACMPDGNPVETASSSPGPGARTWARTPWKRACGSRRPASTGTTSTSSMTKAKVVRQLRQLGAGQDARPRPTATTRRSCWTPTGFVSEATGENIFIVRQRRASRPRRSPRMLDGITRHSLITLARDLGYRGGGAAASPATSCTSRKRPFSAARPRS